MLMSPQHLLLVPSNTRIFNSTNGPMEFSVRTTIQCIVYTHCVYYIDIGFEKKDDINNASFTEMYFRNAIRSNLLT